MKQRNTFIGGAMLVLLLLIGSFQSAYSQFKVVAYAASWSVVPANIQYDKVTHINYSFIRPTGTGGLTAVDQAWKLQDIVTRAHAQGAKVGIAIGGWSDFNNWDFQSMSSNSAYRAAFVNNVINFLNQYNLDGVDIDWEFPKDGSDPQNFATLMSDLANALRPRGKYVSAAVQPEPYWGVGILSSVFNSVDMLNLMIYDLGGSNHSSWQATLDAISYWTGRGCPANKLTLGVPFYTRPGGITYSSMLAQGASPNADSFNGQSYNGIPTIKAKTNLAFDRGIGGMMIWEISQDATGANSLLSAMDQVVVEREGNNNNNNNEPQGPYQGTARAIPGKIEAEHYDVGGQGVAYNDATSGNQGGALRTDGVDIETNQDGGAGYNVGWISAGEWLEYTVDIKSAGRYTLDARVATQATGKTFHVEIDGVNISGNITVPNTGNWQNWQTVSVTTTSLTTGVKVMRVVFDGGDININHLNFAPVQVTQTPYQNTVRGIPGKIEAEHYDEGGEGVAYHDNTTTNSGAALRNDGVDVESSQDVGTGHNVGWLSAGEWLEYTVNVTTAGSYKLEARVASMSAGKTFHVEIDGQNVSGAIAVPNTGGWQIWQTVSVNTTNLTTGQKVMRIVMDAGDFNLNYLNFSTGTTENQRPTVSITSPSNGASVMAPANINIQATASDADGNVSKVEFYNGANKLGEDPTAPYSFAWNNVAAGTYSITAVATDNSGATTSSSVITVSVVTADNKVPTVSIISPSNGASFNAPASITIQANASDADGSVTKVEFYNGVNRLGEDLTSPYSFAWNNVAAGTYSITAKATDNKGATTTSSVITITVKSSTGCNDPQYTENGGYVAGSKVQNAGNVYQCKPWPFSGWCNGAAWAYAPGTGAYWQDAWALVGNCSARVGANDIAAANVIEIYPNPTENRSVVKLNAEVAEAEIVVINSVGNVVYTGNMGTNLETTVDLKAMENGIYTIKIRSGEEFWVEKLVKF